MKSVPWLAHAWAEYGQREVKGKRDNARILALYRDAGHPSIKHDEVPWCAAFVGAVLQRAGLPTTGSLMARSYLNWGQPIDAAQPGALAIFSRGTNPAYGHVGFVLGETGSSVYLLGGNQSDAVTVGRYPKKRLLGFRWPNQGLADNHHVESARQPRMPDNVFDHLLDVEGGYTNDPVDPGGPTNKGITLGVYAAWKDIKLSPGNRARLLAELTDITDGTVRDIYEARYWQPAHAGELEPPLALMHMDAAVNHGVGTAIRFLQIAVGAEPDGEVGPLTRTAIAKHPIEKILQRYADIRRRRYRQLNHFWRFGRGWLSRVDKTLARALDIQKSARVVLNNKDFSTRKKKEVPEMVTNNDGLQAKWWGESLTIWGAIVTAAATVMPTLGPVIGWDISADMIEVAGKQAVQVVQAFGGLIGTALTIYGRARATTRIVQRPFSIQF